MKSKLVSYTSRTAYSALAITVTSVGCDCSHVRWDNPSHLTPTVAVGTPSLQTVPVPTFNDGLKTTINAFDICI